MVRGSDTANRLTYALKESAPKDVRQKAMAEIGSAMLSCNGDVSRTAEYLGIGRATLNRWIDTYPYLKKSLDHARRVGPTYNTQKR